MGVDPQTGFIYCHTLTLNDIDDGSQLKNLLGQIKPKVKEVYLDGAYDHFECETTMVRFKTIHGPSFFSRKFESQQKYCL